MKNLKTLVCVLAETRAHKITWKNFKKNLIDPVNGDLALCIAVTEDYDFQNPFWQFARFRWDVKEYADWGVAFDQIQDILIENRKLNNKPNWRKLIDIKDQWLGGVRGEGAHPGSAGILLYFRWVLLKMIMENNLFDYYDRYIITRSDFYWLNPHPEIDLLDEQYMWIPDGEGYEGFTDRHVVLNRDNLFNYLNIIEEVLLEPENLYKEMNHHSNWNLEKFIKFKILKNLDRNRIKFFPYLMYSVREWNGSTSWSKGYWSDELGYYIKYKNEFESAKILSENLRTISWRDIISNKAKYVINAPLLINKKFIVYYEDKFLSRNLDFWSTNDFGLHIDINPNFSRIFLSRLGYGAFERKLIDEIQLIPSSDENFQIRSKLDNQYYFMLEDGTIVKSNDQKSNFSFYNRYNLGSM